MRLIQPRSTRAARLMVLAERSAGEVPAGGIWDIFQPRNTVYGTNVHPEHQFNPPGHGNLISSSCATHIDYKLLRMHSRTGCCIPVMCTDSCHRHMPIQRRYSDIPSYDYNLPPSDKASCSLPVIGIVVMQNIRVSETDLDSISNPSPSSGGQVPKCHYKNA